MMKNKMNMKIPHSTFHVDENIYKIKDIDQLLESFTTSDRVTHRKINYYNIPFSFDIETTSFYENNEKRSIMYAFVLGINGKCIIGRTWNEFKHLLNVIESKLELSIDNRIIIYVHNLQFEFQFIRKHFEWESIFATAEREPLKAVTKSGIEFRCSYRLSGYSLAKTGEHLQKYKINKMVGDLDYKLLRNSKTELSQQELKYILNDGLVVMAYIQEEIESHKNNIGKIELTKTGKVRTLCRKNCLYGDSKSHRSFKAQKQFTKFSSCISKLTLDVPTYKQLKRAFQGGFTHANANYVQETILNVASYDFSSAYPSVLLLEKYPMTKFRKVKISSHNQLLDYLNYYSCLFDITFINIRSKVNFEHYISSSKCYQLNNAIFDNGRIVEAENLSITITEQDFKIIYEMYEWESMKIKNFRIANRGYLPKEFINTILTLYNKKNLLKGVIGQELEYLNSKENLNSLYGMCVTDINRNEVTYSDNEWNTIESSDETLEKNLEKYNNDRFRYLFYAWGVWCTAYNRYNLFKAILDLKDDYVYSDTDSVKFLNYEEHKPFFDNYNKNILHKIQLVAKIHDIDVNEFSPKTIKGIVKTIGYFDFEGIYKKFKTLGAKRYLVVNEDGSIQITTSGLAKSNALNYLKETYITEDKIFANFDLGMYIPKGHTGKLIHTYIDEETSGELIDYKGVKAKYHEYSCIHLEEADYLLDFAKEFINYLKNIKIYYE